MIIKPILSAIISDIFKEGYFALQNYAGLPIDIFENMVETEIHELKGFYVKGDNRELIQSIENSTNAFKIYVSADLEIFKMNNKNEFVIYECV